MHYGESKVYFDGSHYIAIPHTTRPKKKRHIQYEEEITITENATNIGLEDTTSKPLIVAENISIFDEKKDTEINKNNPQETLINVEKIETNNTENETNVIERKLTKSILINLTEKEKR